MNLPKSLSTLQSPGTVFEVWFQDENFPEYRGPSARDAARAMRKLETAETLVFDRNGERIGYAAIVDGTVTQIEI